MKTNVNGIPDEWRLHCNDEALKCWGTAYMFEKRAKAIRWKIKLLSFLGIAVPATLGALLGSFLLKPQYLNIAIIIVAAAVILQLVFSIWSVVDQWNDKLSYYIESKSSNYRLAGSFKELADNISHEKNNFDLNKQILDAENKYRTDLDNRYDVSDEEKRIVMHAGLYKYQRPCAICKEVPKSLKQTKGCETCGK